MTRSVSVCVAVACVISSARLAQADGMLPNGAELNFNKFFLQNSMGEFEEPADEDAKRFYLNLAHCECSRKMLGLEQKIQYEITITASSGSNRPAEVWLGTECNDDTKRAMQCRKLETQGIANIDTLLSSPKIIELSVFDFVNPTTADQMLLMCNAREQAAKVWLLVDADANGSYEYFKTIDIPTTATNAATSEVKVFDTLVPEVPTGIRASGGEESIVISWTAPTNTESIYMYQALCIDPDDEPVASIDAKYQTQFDVCGQDSGVTLEAIDPGGAGAPIEAIPPEFAALDNRFICGEATQTATSLTVREVDNGKPYRVALLAMDRYGNVDGVWFNRAITPEPVTDLWEDINDRNSAIDGGCLLSQTYGEGNPLTRLLRDFRDTTLSRTAYGRALVKAYYATLGKLSVEGSLVLRVIAALYLLPLVVVALLWHALTLPGMLALFALLAFRRRLRLRLPRVRRLVLAAALLVPSLASADDFEPYWDTEENDDSSLLDFPEVKWHAGIRVGPYIPEIDLQLGLNAVTGKGPYEAMFGDYYTRNSAGELVKHEQRVWQVLPMLDVDRVLWDGFGQLTVGGSIGYMQKSAYAYLDGTTEDQPMRERSTASKNTFRLIPAAATVGYRFTYLDDMWGIPVVPYLRGGLSYYVWWIKSPNGNVSKVCDDFAADMTCANEDKAYGGSLGFQGSVGIAIRAERIDADAAMSMRNSGIMHAGFYAELSYAKVDGFGSDSKLSVGDNTWFAGVNFEF